MANTIRHKRSGVAGTVPLVAQLTQGELAVNHADGAVYLLKSGATPVVVRVGGTNFTFSASPPAGALNGDRWCATGTGLVFTCLDDGTSTQWVELEARSRVI